MMTLNSIISDLREAAGLTSSLAPDARWYIFGSMLNDPKSASDIDVLIIYRPGTNTLKLREALSPLCVRMPVHLLLLSTDEEGELDFVKAEGCKLIVD